MWYNTNVVTLYYSYTYLHTISQFDTAFGEYTPWSTGDGTAKISDLDKSLTTDRLGQSNASTTLDEMVSRIIEDDPNSQR